uniref:Uncharacterized protein n=1 Tax=Rhizophora mucronata TaxID=61149 RepID=A0A2P2NY54_RHIMU
MFIFPSVLFFEKFHLFVVL